MLERKQELSLDNWRMHLQVGPPPKSAYP